MESQDRHKARGWAICIGILLLLTITPANGSSFTEIAKRARAEYALAQAEWQRGLADLVIRTSPEFAAIAAVQRDLQLAYTEAMTARFEYLLKHYPSRIVLTNGLSQFINFEWSDKDTKALIKTAPSFAALERKVSELRKKNDGQPDWPRFREYFRNTLSKSKEYGVLLKEFMSKTKRVETLLQSYKSK